MTESLLLGLAGILVLGIGAQWVAWRFRLPSILLLLISGFVAGPVTGFIQPDAVMGDLLFPFVSLSVGVILFEGGLSLRLTELRDVGTAVRNLITVGVLITWVLASVGAYYLVGFNLGLSIITGSILVVTGPTVIIPLLRHVRPTGRVGTVAKWEGITIDPVGAILAVLVLETTILLTEVGGAAVGAAGGLEEAVLHAVEGLFLELFIGLGAGVAGTLILVLLLGRRMIPDYLQNPVVLMVVVGIFALSNLLQEEAGLLSTTLMGVLMANQKYVPVRRIIEFKEDLRVLLIAVLFILLSARLDLQDLQYIGVGSLFFLAALMLVVRPLSVFLSTVNTQLDRKEKLFLSWLAPRGIVAAAVASLFSFRLQGRVAGAEALVPVIFLVIVGTVAIYGLTISPLARWLGLAQPNPQGLLFVGAHSWARRMASLLHEHGFRVLLIDTNLQNVQQARQQQLPAQQANVLGEDVMEQLDLGGIGRLLALTPNGEVNALAALHFSEIFERAEVYQLTTRSEQQRDHEGDLPQYLRGRPLFGRNVTHADLAQRFAAGEQIHVVSITESLVDLETRLRRREEATPLFIIRANGRLHVYSDDRTPVRPQPGDHLLVLAPADLDLTAPVDDEAPAEAQRAPTAPPSKS